METSSGLSSSRARRSASITALALAGSSEAIRECLAHFAVTRWRDGRPPERTAGLIESTGACGTIRADTGGMSGAVTMRAQALMRNE